MAFNWKNRNITYKHINISTFKITKDAPWYNQLGATLADSTDITNDTITFVSGILIFNKKLQGDENKTFSILNIGIKEILKLNIDADVLENNHIFIKFYRVMPPKASPAATQNLRLMYAVENPDSNEHQQELYKHPQMIEVDADGTFELPIGNYGRRGWEIVYVSKTEEFYKFLYRYNNEPYLPIDNLTIDFSSNGKLVKKDEVEKVTEPDKYNMCEYKIPYFGIQNRSIIGTGYYGGALYENNNFKTKNKIKPFNSIEPQYWNLSTENYEIIYNGEVNIDQNHLVSLLWLNQSRLRLIVSNQSYDYNIGPKDEVILYVRRPGTYNITQPIPYTKITTSDPYDIDYNKLPTGVVDLLAYRDFGSNRRATYVSGVTGRFFSKGEINFANSMDIISLSQNMPFLQSPTLQFTNFSSTSYPTVSGIWTYPCTPLQPASDLYKFYSHIIKYQTRTFTNTFTNAPYDSWNTNPMQVNYQSSYINRCYIGDNINESNTKQWTGQYDCIVTANIPTLDTSKTINIGFRNEAQFNTFIRGDKILDEFYYQPILNFIKLGGSIDSTKTTAGIIDRTSKGILGIQNNQTDYWKSINIRVNTNSTSNFNTESYYINETQKNTQNGLKDIRPPIQHALKSWIGWSTEALDISYAIWVVIWRWSNITN